MVSEFRAGHLGQLFHRQVEPIQLVAFHQLKATTLLCEIGQGIAVESALPQRTALLAPNR